MLYRSLCFLFYTNLYNFTPVNLTGSATDPYIAASVGGIPSNSAINLNGFASATGLIPGTWYLGVFAASSTSSQTFTGATINLNVLQM